MNAIDLFSGAGGLTLGFARAGIRPICCVELNRDAVETYSSHTPNTQHFCTDVRALSFVQHRGKVDLVYGGPPCQPFSTGGLRLAEDDRRNMVPSFVRVVAEVQPEAFFMENVPGLAVESRIGYLQRIIRELSSLGYRVDWRVLNAADFGIPQKRKRLFVVGMRERAFRFPIGTHGPGGTLPHAAAGSVISKYIACGQPPVCPVKYARYPDMRKSPYAGHLYNGGGRPIDLSEPCHTILASAGGYKTHWVDTLDVAPEYHRHLSNGGSPRDGIVPGTRRLTIEESALLQTFPADLRFHGSRSSQYTQIGDAVPPALAEVLGNALTAQLGDVRVDEHGYYPPQLVQMELAIQ